MKTGGTNLLLLTISDFWRTPEGNEVSHLVVVIDRFNCSWLFDLITEIFQRKALQLESHTQIHAYFSVCVYV